MKVSIITPCWNSESTISRTLNSIKAQSYRPLECIIVDNLSSDNTLNIVKEILAEEEGISLNVISEKDEGISDAFNKGVKESTGEVVGILNSDDAYHDKNIISEVAKGFQKDSELTFIHGDMLFMDEDYSTNRRRPLLCPVDYAMPYNHPTMFLKKSLYEKIGLFKKSYRLAMDFELILRMYESVDKCRERSLYISEIFVDMYAGGISDQLEMKSIDEVERALKEHNFWSKKAWKNLSLRRMRIQGKSVLSKVGLKGAISLWRSYKWR